jgi:error-prone DNA polymerase
MAGELRGRVWLAASRAYAAQDLKRLSRLSDLARNARAPMVATNDVLYHGPERRPLQDVMTCIREGCTITEAGFRLEANAERHIKTPPRWPGCSSAGPRRWSARWRSSSASASTWAT